MLRWSINLFRVRGIQLAVHVTFFALLPWAAWDGFNDHGLAGSAWEVALLLAFFACITLHELGHSFTAMHFGVTVRRIFILPFGGMALFDEVPRSSRQELLITAAGPAVNLAIAGVLWLGHGWWMEPLTSSPVNIREFGFELMFLNVAVGLFNLIPAFPMDGGRILRALLAYPLPYARATFWAAAIGKVLAVIGITVAAIYHLWLLIALIVFLLVVGELEYREAIILERRDAHWAVIEKRLQSTLPHVP